MAFQASGLGIAKGLRPSFIKVAPRTLYRTPEQMINPQNFWEAAPQRSAGLDALLGGTKLATRIAPVLAGLQLANFVTDKLNMGDWFHPRKAM